MDIISYFIISLFLGDLFIFIHKSFTLCFFGVGLATVLQLVRELVSGRRGEEDEVAPHCERQGRNTRLFTFTDLQPLTCT